MPRAMQEFYRAAATSGRHRSATSSDVLWTHNSLELWDVLVRQRRWSSKRYGAFIG